jgi:microcystin-dependent protein
MASPYVGQIMIFGGNFAPAGWMLCQGQLLPISEYETLFQLIGTTYGGDGQSTFGLPDLRGRAPVHVGQGPSITQNYTMGEMAGTEYVTVTTQTMASHNHGAAAMNADGNANVPGTTTILANEGGADKDKVSIYAPWDNDAANMTTLLPTSIAISGGGQPHENRQEYLTLNYIISLFGVFPSQN